jgi:hypothetical protein
LLRRFRLATTSYGKPTGLRGEHRPDVVDAYNFRINHDVDQDSWYEDLRTRVVLGAAPSCNDTALAEDLALLDKTFADALLVYKP